MAEVTSAAGTPPAWTASRSVPRGTWTLVARRSYGPRVFRVDSARGGAYYVKTTPVREADTRFHPVAEAERLAWLRGHGLPVPEVLDVGVRDGLTWLVTTAVPGRPASGPWSAAERPRVVRVLAEAAAALHALPVGGCPFDGRLRTTLAWAETAAHTGRVDLDDLDEHHLGWSAGRLLDALRGTPAPPEDPVVCHGDLCPDNVLVDPDTLALTGIIDAGRLGAADRWRDLAVVLRELGDAGGAWPAAERHDEAFLRGYGITYDAPKADFYRLLDEFF
ncbi:aminoglycoside 3'-phosphotransferase [Streptomyces sp. MUM 203J]|uniref:APH(3') family aminoglycoside O-phosphotransferase n=1 Tax=Streptomyces sp. MUM 203J TaxID=2791990 RepID=UPI001F03ABEB|nr:APH(3') family aminoglycoside O-phosphotransferase [Streptomyces sp. MUM 203J]MCH0541486.1 aminoglycoside 3'-phosphotransferase [Streptomyces sp. MUM 203J]